MCNDDVIVVPDMLYRDIQLYSPNMRLITVEFGVWRQFLSMICYITSKEEKKRAID